MTGVEPYAKLLLYDLGNDFGSPYAGIQTAGDGPALDDIPQLNFILRTQSTLPATAMALQ
jgi:hypothetical protein